MEVEVEMEVEDVRLLFLQIHNNYERDSFIVLILR